MEKHELANLHCKYKYFIKNIQHKVKIPRHHFICILVTIIYPEKNLRHRRYPVFHSEDRLHLTPTVYTLLKVADSKSYERNLTEC